MKSSMRSHEVPAEVKTNGVLSHEILARLAKSPDLIQAISTMFTAGIVTKTPLLEEGPTTTPGPWKFKGSGELVNKKGETIGTFHGAQKAGRKGYKNRNLIRMSPELLALVQKVAESFPVDDPLAQEAKALVDKAQP